MILQRLKTPAFVIGLTGCCLSGLAQQGDREGHVMTPPPAHWKIPPAPVLSPQDALATMKLEEGFVLDLVVAEPLVQDPVAITFDGNGRMWVAEMKGYMPDIDGLLEDSTYGRISVLEDTDGDGVYDKGTVFLEQYLLPRAVALVDGDKTLMFADNLKLYTAAIHTDEAGNITAGKVEVIDDKYAEGGNPEHKPNGLMYGLDNWLYSSKSSSRYRKINGTWVKEVTEDRGQWGISQDNYGRILTNTNSNLVTYEEIPPNLTKRNPHYSFKTNVNTRVDNQRVWPSRITPGVNRGYMEGTLTEEGYLMTPTAVSGLVLYRGDQFPQRYANDIFITEPAGMLVKRVKGTLNEKGFHTLVSATQGFDFLTSTDERSRMVNAHNAPDGSLYFVDMYRGIIQHRVYMTSYLRAQVEERKLDEHINLGRIWRVRHEEGKPLTAAPRMQQESSEKLVTYLSHPSGWWRDTAQRLIVERGGEEAVAALRALAVDQQANGLGRIHAAWTLVGLERYDVETALAVIGSQDPHVAAEGIRAAEILVGDEKQDEIVTALESRAEVEHFMLRRQLAASLGLFGDQAYQGLNQVVTSQSGDPVSIDLALSGLDGREFAFFQAQGLENPLKPGLLDIFVRRNRAEELDVVLGSLSKPGDYGLLARAAATHRRAGVIRKLLAIAADAATADPVKRQVIRSLVAAGKHKQFKPIPVTEVPELESLKKAGTIEADSIAALEKLFEVGSGKEVVYLTTEAHREQFKQGEMLYQMLCLACHQAHGNGQEFLAPPLVGSEWVVDSPKRLTALLMDGVSGPIEVKGKVYTAPEVQPIMPGFRFNPAANDEQLAAVMTYIRNAWGNGATPVDAEYVKQYRENNPVREPWPASELQGMK